MLDWMGPLLNSVLGTWPSPIDWDAKARADCDWARWQAMQQRDPHDYADFEEIKALPAPSQD